MLNNIEVIFIILIMIVIAIINPTHQHQQKIKIQQRIDYCQPVQYQPTWCGQYL